MSESFTHPAVIWFIIGFVFFILEFMIPGLVLFFFALGSWLVAVTVLAFDISLNQQLILFLAASVLTLLLLRKALKQKLWIKKISNEASDDELIGKTGRAETSIRPGETGKVFINGTTWPATSDEEINKGDHVLILGHESILLKVKPSKTQ